MRTIKLGNTHLADLGSIFDTNIFKNCKDKIIKSIAYKKLENISERDVKHYYQWYLKNFAESEKVSKEVYLREDGFITEIKPGASGIKYRTIHILY